MRYYVLILAMFLLTSVHGQEVIKIQDDVLSAKKGLATYYHKRFNGKMTTSGEKYNRDKFTAAHLTLPFGTIVTVTNLSNGKSVDVEINDRGPHGKKYIIDVSECAAKELGFYKKGQSKVEISYSIKS